jgi:esterase/lipase superfamily enzyme
MSRQAVLELQRHVVRQLMIDAMFFDHLTAMHARHLLALLLGCLVFTADVGRAIAGECDDDLWMVSTRRLPGICGLPDHADLDVERRIAGRWERADVADLLDAPGQPLVFFIHGNRYESSEAKSQGMSIARQLAAVSPAVPPRMVVFSWPSQQQGRLIASSRENYRRSSADGHYLAWLLGRVSPEQPVAIIGYSLGAVVAAEALSDLAAVPASDAAGGWGSRPGRTHLVLVAPAMRADALAPRGQFGAATSGINRLTLVLNSRDLALRMFPHLDRESNTSALGTVGMSRRWVPAHVEFSATDAAPVVGARHALPEYFQSASLMRRIATGAVAGLAD